MWHIEPLEAAKNRLPGRPDDFFTYALWNCTAYPFGRAYKTLRQLVRFDVWAKQGISACMCCGNPYLHKSGKGWLDDWCAICQHREKGERG